MTRNYRQMTITGDTAHEDVIGLRVRVRSLDYGTLVGVVERVECVTPIVRFGNGRTFRGDRVMRVLRDQTTPLSTPGE